VEKINLHKQTREVIYRDLLKTIENVGKLEKILSKLEKQVKHEKTSNIAKSIKIEDLKKKFVSLGYNEAGPKPFQDLIKQKDTEILALKKK